MNKFATFTALAATLAFTSIAAAGHGDTRAAHQGRKAHLAFQAGQTYALTGQAPTQRVKSAEFTRHVERMNRIHRGGRAGH